MFRDYKLNQTFLFLNLGMLTLKAIGLIISGVQTERDLCLQF